MIISLYKREIRYINEKIAIKNNSAGALTVNWLSTNKIRIEKYGIMKFWLYKTNSSYVPYSFLSKISPFILSGLVSYVYRSK